MRYPKFQRLAAELASLSSHAFQRRCWELLRELWPDLIYARELGNLDTKGIDLYTLGKGPSVDFDVVIQCKGLEIPRFEKGHLRDCISSIEKFSCSDLRTGSYYLVVNRPIIESTNREKLEEELKKLAKYAKAEVTYLLDLHGFTQFLLKSLKEKLLLRVQSLDAQHLAHYERVMGKGIYIDAVPFIEERYKLRRSVLSRLTQQVANNPHQHLLTRFTQRSLESPKYQGSPPKLWDFVISEFGFGKTSLLLRLGVHLWNAGLPALYVPVVEIPRDGFVNERALAKSFLQIIFREDEEVDVRELDLWTVALSSLLRTRADFVLLLDGLDEHRDAYSHEGIRRIFDCLRDYACSTVLSMRQEFWDERRGNLELGLSKLITSRDFVFLTEWDDQTIASYIEEVQHKLQKKKQSLDQFLSLVRGGKYVEVYGDIPKRPLFLSMLVEDVMAGKVQKTTLSSLYERYVLQKMWYDQESPFGNTSRPLPLVELDFDDLRRRFLLMLERLALNTVVAGGADEACQLLEKFPERWAKDAAQLVGLPGDQIIPFLMNTILVTASSRSVSKEIDVRFAHRSFQEYFVARCLIQLLKEDSEEEVLRFWGSRFNTGVVKFVKEILHDIQIQPDESSSISKCLDRLRQLFSTCQGECIAINILFR